MDATQITDMAQWVADVVTTDGGLCLGVKMGEMADGSHRHYALVDMYSGGLEQQYRVTTPAPWNSPAWATHLRAWRVEVRVGEGQWLELDAMEAATSREP